MSNKLPTLCCDVSQDLRGFIHAFATSATLLHVLAKVNSVKFQQCQIYFKKFSNCASTSCVNCIKQNFHVDVVAIYFSVLLLLFTRLRMGLKTRK